MEVTCATTKVWFQTIDITFWSIVGPDEFVDSIGEVGGLFGQHAGVGAFGRLVFL